jgi:hypothetical protein
LFVHQGFGLSHLSKEDCSSGHLFFSLLFILMFFGLKHQAKLELKVCLVKLHLNYKARRRVKEKKSAIQGKEERKREVEN